jgi:hypothetical protein
MLNLSIAMHRLILPLLLFFQGTPVEITSPQNGSTVRGQVEILGSMDVPNFASAELSFGYASEGNGSLPAEGWFSIQTFAQPRQDAPLAVWDTTSVTDGIYNLRLRVILQDGTIQDVLANGLKVANDSPEPTSTPLELIETPALAVIATGIPPTPTLPVFSQPTPLPANPAALTVPAVQGMFGRGALIALVLFAVVSFFLRLRKD